MTELLLPAFHLDCRNWLVISPEELGLAEAPDGPPVLAVLSTVVLDGDEFRPASGVLTVGLLDGDVPSRPLRGSCVARRMIDPPAGDLADGARRYFIPVPYGDLAVVADFDLPAGDDAAVIERVETLVCSFRWAA